MISNEAYKLHHDECPRCRSSEIQSHGGIESYEGYAKQNISCASCGLEYEDHYELKGYVVTNIRKENQ